MEYIIYKLKFAAGVHFGDKSLEDGEYALYADTLFSAICSECAKEDAGMVETLVKKVREGKILISDAMPYIKDTYYIPKPMIKVEAEDARGDSVIKKAYKKLAYIPANFLDEYIGGKMNVKDEADCFQHNIGKKMVRVCSNVRNEENETKPYRVGTYYFNADSGLYVIAGFQDNQDKEQLEKCLEALGMSGIGGKRASGLGRFNIIYGSGGEDIIRRLRGENGRTYMSLSICLPREYELETVLETAGYLLKKRSGFVSSLTYAKEQRRKKDIYLMQSGSCFSSRFQGDVYDVSTGGTHPVYRYAKPMFMEVIS